ncbi:MAG: hypothetical protein FJW96_13760 [Actinobacteria bacterium]|nr:hypothetical protein [Actinomycetota bacterium]
MDDEERALSLRRDAFLRAGFPAETAEALARRTEIAYLDALALVRHGFPPEVAAAMLLDGRRGVF